MSKTERSSDVSQRLKEVSTNTHTRSPSHTLIQDLSCWAGGECVPLPAWPSFEYCFHQLCSWKRSPLFANRAGSSIFEAWLHLHGWSPHCLVFKLLKKICCGFYQLLMSTRPPITSKHILCKVVPVKAAPINVVYIEWIQWLLVMWKGSFEAMNQPVPRSSMEHVSYF